MARGRGVRGCEEGEKRERRDRTGGEAYLFRDWEGGKERKVGCFEQTGKGNG